MLLLILSLLLTVAYTRHSELPDLGPGDLEGIELPMIDIGYSIYQASSYDSKGELYIFRNIRYAASPTGALRFAPPAAPPQNRTVQDGSYGHVCPQAASASQIALLHILGRNASSEATADLQGEDCLFLDVYVPKKVLDRKNIEQVPVLVWIYGGGFTQGYKDAPAFNPTGLLDVGNNSFIYVALNYRLGVFGFMAGPTFTSTTERGTANLGFYDQRFALDWVQDNIHLFGGDLRRVTVMGESAGGASVLHQITAYGGQSGKPPFSQAIVQSPGWLPVLGHKEKEELYQTFLSLLKCSTLECARAKDGSEVMKANAALVNSSVEGSFGPFVDGIFVPETPANLLLSGAYSTGVNLMLGSVADEGFLVVLGGIAGLRNTTDFTSALKLLFPLSTSSVRSHISDTLYPASSLRSDSERINLLVTEALFTCNNIDLSTAANGEAYFYRFSVPPSFHGQDLPYTFFNGPTPAVTNTTVANLIQGYIVNFLRSGDPNEKGTVFFPKFGKGTMLDLGNHAGSIEDPTKGRCAWWQNTLYI